MADAYDDDDLYSSYDNFDNFDPGDPFDPDWELEEIDEDWLDYSDYDDDYNEYDQDYDDDEVDNDEPEIMSDDEDETRNRAESKSEDNSVGSPWEDPSNVQKVPSVYANRHAFYSRIDEFWNADKYTDVNIICENRIFKCHRLVLAAASEYFDTMFYGGFRESRAEDIPLHGVEVTSFEEVLRYAYKGEVAIDEDNVYGLLCASEMFGLSFIENCCVRYLRERTVPKDSAIEIFMYACRTQKNTLLPAVSRFILENLEDFSRDSEFLDISFDELNTWLLNCPLLSPRQENFLLDAICKWISRLNCPFEEKKSFLTKLTQRICFQYISTERIAEYFDKNVIDNDVGSGVVALDIVNPTRQSNPSLHVYVNTGTVANSEINRTNLFTMQKGIDDVEWHISHVMEPAIDDMQSVVCNDRLYCLKSQQGKNTFSVCSTIDLSTDSQSLALPICTSQLPVNEASLCCDKNKIYVFHSSDWTNIEELFIYSRELDAWSICSADNKKSATMPSVTCDDNRIYLIGGRWTNRYLQAYDYRAGKWEQLRKSKLSHSWFDKSCVHKDKIYVHCGSTNKGNMMEVYDPVAGKWETLEIESNSSHQLYPVRSLSYDNRLYIFTREPQHKFVGVQTYDSFLQEWSVSSKLHSAIENSVCSTSTHILDMLDAIVF